MSEKIFGSVEIPLSEGTLWADKYKKASGLEEDGKKKVCGYLIPLETLKLVLDQDIDAVRAYKGINNAGEQVLMFVGTKLDPETGIYRDVFKTGQQLKSGDGDVVYDASRPCPPYGDPESPM
ncbi:hypothetical protein [Flavobacterium reichenbachii]|uniref:Uncharacterized protein n=1 Tax=Flavobacterium reichenbachii TaxID=362418 RepID=A0A085ZI12_9FLAO|nr:hypothetical protein [Flavobacterium reichenbachii]KFF04076.1 hypothetical protein IW19_00360 [Flavobacterium reichenbachii]OXB12873.1 hypothetical protein B0A68_17050 [Flavobacterium reichenbachii]